MQLDGINRCVSQSSDPVSKAVEWFRAEDQSPAVKLIRTTAAVFAAFLLSLTVVGIYFVIRASIIWMEQESQYKKKLPQVAEAAPKGKDESQTRSQEDRQTQIEKPQQATLKAAAAAQQLDAKKAEEEAQRRAALRKAAAAAQQRAAVKKAEEEAQGRAAAKNVEGKQNLTGPSAPSSSAFSEAVHPSSTTSSSSIPYKVANGFPTPFESLTKMNLFKPEEFPAIIERVNKALTTFKGEPIIPSEYLTLEKKWIGSKQQLEQLYDEAKIFAHDIALKELGSLPTNRSEYQKCLYPNLRMLLSYLAKYNQFPPNIDAWVESGF
ncbi:MAG: hypothetical protein ACHQUC_04160 [Chlamydiales bacterium]